MMKTKKTVRGFCLVLAAALVVSVFAILRVPVQAANTTAMVSVEVTYGQTQARSMLEDINALRTSEEDAWYWNSDDTTKTEQTADELIYDYGLEAEAMQRAAEIAISFSHTRPNGTTCFTALSVYGSASIGENIAAGYTSADSVFIAWSEEDEDYSGQGHRRNMLSTSYKYVGIGHVYYQGRHYWVQEFSSRATSLTETTANDSLTTVSIDVLLSDLSSASTTAEEESLTVDEGSLVDYPELATSIIMSNSWPSTSRVVTPDYTYEIADTDIAVLTDDGIQGVAYGTTTLTVTSTLGTTLEIPVTVNCGHSYDSGAITTEPTCTETGIRTYTCTKCGETYTETVTATGHNYEPEVTEATCTEGGYTTYTCSVCGDSYTGDETRAAGHSYEAVLTEPTCTEGGYTTYTCSECGASYIGDETEAAGHSYESEITTEPTCTEEGVTTYTCTECDDTYTESIAATGHSYSEAVIVTEPTCTQEGEMTYTCDVCGEDVNEVIAATGHSYEAVVTEPTCTEGGYTTYTCSVCGDSHVEDKTEATGHNYVDNICKYCGALKSSTVTSATVTLSKTSYTYSGSACTPTVTVKVNGTTLTSSDYTVTCSNNTSVGTATVTIKGKGSYSGTTTATFTISAQKLSGSKVSLSYTSKTYTGKSLKPTVTVKNASGSKLRQGTDYTVTYKNNKNAGTATVTITGKNNYTGTISKTFKITKAAQSLTVKKAAKTVKYSKVSKAKQTVKAITKVSGAKGTVTYKKTSGSAKFTVNAKTGKITVKKGTKKGTYKIKIIVTAAATGNYKKATKTVTVTIKVK